MKNFFVKALALVAVGTAAAFVFTISPVPTPEAFAAQADADSYRCYTNMFYSDTTAVCFDASTKDVHLFSNDTDVLEVTAAGHVLTKGDAPAASSCGTSPSVAGSDAAGKVTVGTSASDTCTLTFDTAYATAPACTVSGDDPAFALTAVSTTTTLIVTCPGASDFSSDVISYNCVGY